MRTADVTTALLLAAGGLLVLWDSLRIGVGWSTDGPQSGFFPFWLALALLACCASIVVQAIRRGDHTPFVYAGGRGAGAQGAGAGPRVRGGDPVRRALRRHRALHGLLHALDRAPLVARRRRLEPRVPVVTFVVFEMWFLVPMPKGPLEAWLGY